MIDGQFLGILNSSRRMEALAKRFYNIPAERDVPMMEGLVFRRATFNDYELVCNLIEGGLYEETDYLPANYDQYLKDPDRYSYVGVLNGEIVVFLMAFIVDGGKTYIGEDIRVRSDMMQKGLSKRMLLFAFQDVFLTRMSIRCLRDTQVNIALWKRNFQSGKIYSYSFIMELLVLEVFRGEIADMKRVASQAEARCVCSSTDLPVYLNPDAVHDLIADVPTITRIISPCVFFSASVAIRASLVNLDLITKRMRLFGVKCQDGCYSSLCACTALQIPLGLELSLEVWGKLDERLLCKYILTCMYLVKEFYIRGKVYVELVLPNEARQLLLPVTKELIYLSFHPKMANPPEELVVESVIDIPSNL